MTPEEALAAAWTMLAPNREKSIPFPRGFWPDVARVAMEMFSQQSITPALTFRPTQCQRGNYPQPTPSNPKTAGGKLSAAEKAANTARLLAMLSTKEPT